MASVLWEITHSVEADAGPEFAWNYWANVANWEDPPAEFELNGPFATGSRGITRVPGQEPFQWILRDVTPPNAATMEINLDGAALSFEWRFTGLADGRTRLTNRIVLKGEKAEQYASQVEAAFGGDVPGGMKKMAASMANADPNRKSARD
jgi:hypothetical protein